MGMDQCLHRIEYAHLIAKMPPLIMYFKKTFPKCTLVVRYKLHRLSTETQKALIFLPSCVSAGSWGVCRTCHSPAPCSSKACHWCERESASSGRCCWRIFGHSRQTRTWRVSLLREGKTVTVQFNSQCPITEHQSSRTCVFVYYWDYMSMQIWLP